MKKKQRCLAKKIISFVLAGMCCILFSCCAEKKEEEFFQEEIEKVEYQLPEIEWATKDGTTYKCNTIRDAWLSGLFYWNGPNGLESYYCLDVDTYVSNMRASGFSEEEYPYWIDEAGFQKLGQYIMCAANHELYPLGTLINGEFGTYVVVDYWGGEHDPNYVEIYTDWYRYIKYLNYCESQKNEL